MKISNRTFFILLLVSFLFCYNLFPVRLAFAEDTLIKSSGTCTPESCKDESNKKAGGTCTEYCGNYELPEIVGKIIFVSGYILGICASLTLLAFIIGGVMFLGSAGNSTWVERGKATIIGAVIGLVIVFATYMVINFVLTNVFNVQDPNLTNGNWANVKK